MAKEEFPAGFKREELEAWLSVRPVSWSVALAARASLRILPRLSAIAGSRRARSEIILPVFRANQVAFSWFTGEWDNPRYRASVNSATKSADRAYAMANGAVFAADEDYASASQASAAASAAFVAANAVLSADLTRDDPMRNAALNACDVKGESVQPNLGSLFKQTTAQRDLAAALNWDRHFLQDIERSKAEEANQLMEQTLWPPVGEWKLAPDWAMQLLDSLEEILVAQSEEFWQVWTDWYARRLMGAPINHAEERVWTRDVSFRDWDEGPSIANARIAEIIARIDDQKKLANDNSLELAQKPNVRPDQAVEPLENEASAREEQPVENRAESASLSPEHIRDAVDIVMDDPTEDDRLGRLPFAQLLVDKMNKLREQRGSNDFAVHLHARWGAGKTSILKMMKILMERAPRSHQRWVVVDFNAWEHEQRRPPWWPFVEEVRRSILKSMRKRWAYHRYFSLLLRWWWWELTARFWPVAFLLFSLVLLAVSWPLGGASGEAEPLIERLISGFELDDLMSETAANWTPIAAFFSVLTTGFLTFRNFLFGSEKSAQFYEELSSDPLGRVKRFFSTMVKCGGRPVCVFVDDLDRCQAQYVVMLLEGIQTSFRHRDVAYLVAADRQWIRRSFETEYASFIDMRPDRRSALGYDFLEKIFQISAPVPAMAQRKSDYWKNLVDGEVSKRAQRQSKAKAAGAEIAPGRSTNEKPKEESELATDLNRLVRRMLESVFNQALVALVPGAPTARVILDEIEKARRVYRESRKTTGAIDLEAEIEQAKTEIEKDVVVLEWAESAEASKEGENALMEFEDLLPDNPRVMKRMINAYAVRKATLGIERTVLPQAAIARWTVLEQRFPVVADALIHQPETAKHYGTATEKLLFEEIDEGLHSFISDKTVRRIIAGGKGEQLTVERVEILTRASRTG